MPVLNQQIKATKEMLEAVRNDANKEYIDLLIQLELEDQKVLKIFTADYFHRYLTLGQSDFAEERNATPELINLLSGLLRLKIRLPENPDTILTDLINQFTHDTLHLVHNVVVRNSYKPLKCNSKNGLNMLAVTVNCTANLIDANQTGDEIKIEGAVIELAANADTMQAVFCGSHFEQALLTQLLLTTALILVGAAMLALPFILLAAGVTGVLTLALTSVFVPIPAMMIIALGGTLMNEIAMHFLPNMEVRKVKDKAKEFLENSQRFFASTGKVKHLEEIEMVMPKGFVAAV